MFLCVTFALLFLLKLDKIPAAVFHTCKEIHSREVTIGCDPLEKNFRRPTSCCSIFILAGTVPDHHHTIRLFHRAVPGQIGALSKILLWGPRPQSIHIPTRQCRIMHGLVWDFDGMMTLSKNITVSRYHGVAITAQKCVILKCLGKKTTSVCWP